MPYKILESHGKYTTKCCGKPLEMCYRNPDSCCILNDPLGTAVVQIAAVFQVKFD